MSKKKESSKKKGKFVFIKIHKHVLEVMNEYVEASGMDKHDVGFQMGYISGHGEGIMFPLASLNQLFFFAGIYYAKKYSGKLEYEFVDKKPSSDMDKIRDQLEKASTQKQKYPDYLG
jgi:hypothetical protein